MCDSLKSALLSRDPGDVAPSALGGVQGRRYFWQSLPHSRMILRKPITRMAQRPGGKLYEFVGSGESMIRTLPVVTIRTKEPETGNELG